MSLLFEGKRVLAVEDEPLVAMLLEEMLLDLGCEVIGPAFSIEQATRMAESEALDAAILDVNVNGLMSHSVAAILRDRGVPYAFATGYGASPEIDEDPAVPILQKPYPAEKLQALLQELLPN